MSEFAVAFEFTNNRSASSSGLWNGHVQHVQSSGLTFSAGLTPIPEPDLPRSAHVNQENATGSATNGIAEVMAGLSGATTTGALVARRAESRATFDGPSLASGGPVITQDSDISFGRQSPRYAIVTTGALDTAIDTAIGAPDANSYIHATWSYEQLNPYIGMLHAMDFADDETGDLRTDVPAFMQRMWDLIHRDGTQSYSLGVTSSGTPIVCEDCVWAGVAPEGRVYITAADLGTDLEDIPAAVTSNNATHFRFHPSVFVRRGAYISGISYRYADNEFLNTGGLGNQPLGIIVLNTPITESRWLCSIDGALEIVAFAHPAGSDFRRPRDIWNNVIVPAIRNPSGANVVSSALYGDVLGAPLVSNQIVSRLKYLEYARYIPVPGVGTTQTGTQPA